MHQKNSNAIVQLTDGAVATAFNVMRNLCGPKWKPVEVMFSHRRPDDIKPFHDFFQAPLRFDADQNAIVFSGDWMAHPIVTADKELHRILQKQIDALELRHKRNFPEEVRSAISSALLTGNANVEQVAALFSMHDRTLNRRLAADGTNFQKLMDECRFDMARRMLENSNMEISDIASALCYSDASAFSRAFRRWSGTSPARWRQNVKV